jgi:4-hydroxy-3-methylbut-2-en-1-yl diphosphate synthase IspG/GcpE
MDKIRPTAEVEVALGNLDPAFLDKYDEWTDESLVKSALERLGTY